MSSSFLRLLLWDDHVVHVQINGVTWVLVLERCSKTLPLVQESLEVLALEVLLSALLAPETHLPLQMDRGDKTADLGGDPSTAIFL